jgi:aminoglycoside/choline kinase family phosphotransferase
MLKWGILAWINSDHRDAEFRAAVDCKPRVRWNAQARRSQPRCPRMTADLRLDGLRVWLAQVLGDASIGIAPASADASFRRYFRISFDQAAVHSRSPSRSLWPPKLAQHLEGHAKRDAGTATLIAMDAPPPHEDCRPYVHVASLLIDAGVHAPSVLAQNLEDGFLLLTDLGTQTYLDALHPETATQLIADASTALVRWQSASRPGVLPPYDRALLQRELELFPTWYVEHHLGIDLTVGQRKTLDSAFEQILANNLAQPCVYVHRDFHSRNLMVSSPNPGVLDFQDAVYGPITYDLVSLLRDAYVDWGEAEQIDYAVRYWEQARHARLPVAPDFADFWRDFEWMGVQRQLKVLGIFARLHHRDGKDGYLKDMPRVMGYLRAACDRYRALGPLLGVLDELEQRTHTTGYTF